jgi:hypothetical protein
MRGHHDVGTREVGKQRIERADERAKTGLRADAGSELP